MKKDNLKQFISMRDSLLKEKREIEQRLAQINEALGTESGSIAAPPTARRGRPPGIVSGRGRRNELSLKEAVMQVTTAKPLKKNEILDAIQKLGYRFKAKNPMNSLNVVLYSGKQFKNQDGRFSPVS